VIPRSLDITTDETPLLDVTTRYSGIGEPELPPVHLAGLTSVRVVPQCPRFVLDCANGRVDVIGRGGIPDFVDISGRIDAFDDASEPDALADLAGQDRFVEWNEELDRVARSLAPVGLLLRQLGLSR
jgi:hypothetical protein